MFLGEVVAMAPLVRILTLTCLGQGLPTAISNVKCFFSPISSA